MHGGFDAAALTNVIATFLTPEGDSHSMLPSYLRLHTQLDLYALGQLDADPI